ncbi:peroxiredoxin [Sphingomonas bacterium]|uniref:peroxiredoxin n=1 Tax=Sphingomonas bacterium TaxID=1895847 RepID=UPI001575626D|nr:redoxin domain-containing protein [Sphingomonas bacterium]
MRRLALLAAALLATPALATLAPGAKAPPFTAQGAVAGKPFTVDLATALKKGPVVLYFFPAAFTGGCNAEAHAFAEAMDDFGKAGASVIGVTAGNVDKLEAFSAEKCAGKFAVAAATPAVVKAYDVSLGRATPLGDITSRTSYVIGRDGRIAFVHSDMNPAEHVQLTLAAVRKLAAR